MKPEVHESAFISRDAAIIGDVVIEEDVSVWPHASIRGDLNRIIIRKGANVQDCCVIHVTRKDDTVIGEMVSLGHGAVVHGTHIGERTIIGMNATILDGARIGKGCVIGGGAVVTGGMEIPDFSLVVGVPARIIKQDPKLLEMTTRNAENYLELAAGHRAKKFEHYRA